MRKLLSIGAAAASAAMVCGNALAATYDLKAQWRKTSNPNGVWTMEQGATPLPFDRDWTPLSGTDAAYNPSSGHIRQPAFAPGSQAGHFLPAWFKAAVTPGDPGDGWRKNDIIVHTTDVANGIGSGAAALVFTAPAAGAATLSGYLYNARNIHRPQSWTLAVDGVLMAEGSLPGDGTFTRARKQTFRIANALLQAGTEVVLTVQEDAGPSGAGDYVGLDLKVVLP